MSTPPSSPPPVPAPNRLVPNRPMPNPLMPGLRIRHDGWTAERTRVFLATLGEKGCVRDAARVAGVTSTGAYRMKKRFPLFAAEWAKSLERAHKGLVAIAYQRAVEGKETVIYRDGKEVERRITPDSSMLALLVKQGQLENGGGANGQGGKLAGLDADDILTREEWEQGWGFSSRGGKHKGKTAAEGGREFFDKLRTMRRRLEQAAAEEQSCPHCRQQLPADFPGNASPAELVAAGVVKLGEVFD